MMRATTRKALLSIIAIIGTVGILRLMTSTEIKQPVELDPNIPTYLYVPLEPKVTSDFPIDVTMNVSIPRIIHQIWNDFTVPTQYVRNIRSIIFNHRRWTYYFWTLKTGRQYISRRFPAILSLYDSYQKPVDKADLLRYAVLHEFGGVFLDLDIFSLRPLDRVIASFPCVLVREPQEHLALLYNSEFFLANGVIFTRPHHPFLHFLLTHIHWFQHFDFPSGTKVFTTLFLMYNASLSHGTALPEDSVFVAPSQYFLPEIDPTNHKDFKQICTDFYNLTLIKKRGCASYIERYVKKGPMSEFAFNLHIWGHSTKIDIDPINHIEVIAPDVKMYEYNSD